MPQEKICKQGWCLRSSIQEGEREGERVSRTREKITKSRPIPEESEESAVVCFQKDKSRFFASLRMTANFFTASKYPFLLRPNSEGPISAFRLFVKQYLKSYDIETL